MMKPLSMWYVTLPEAEVLFNGLWYVTLAGAERVFNGETIVNDETIANVVCYIVRSRSIVQWIVVCYIVEQKECSMMKPLSMWYVTLSEAEVLFNGLWYVTL